MKKRKIISFALALTMATGTLMGLTSVSAASANHWTDSFDTNADVVTTAGTQINDSWKLLSNNNDDGRARIFMNHLLILGVLRNPIMVVPTSDELQYMPAENTMTFKMGQANDRAANRSSEMDTGSSTVFTRFAMSDDGNSYYEIGMTGTATAYGLTRTNYPLPTEIGASNYPGSIDYAGRWYFRKVVGGNTTYIEWENADDGMFEISKNADAPTMRRVCSAYAIWDQKVENLGTNDTATETYNPATVSVTTTKSGVEFSVSVNKLYGKTDEEASPSNHSVTWTSSYDDAAPLARKGAKFAFGACGWCGGSIIDDVDFTYSGALEEPSTWTDTFDTDTAKADKVGDAINTNWKVTSIGNKQYGRIYDGHLMAMGMNETKGQTIVEPTVKALKSLPAENTMAFTMGGVCDNAYATVNWTYYSTIFSRFAMSEDKESYYEIGMTGTNSNALTRYPLPVTVGGADASGDDYLGRWYFRKVVDGETTYINWENAEGGMFEITQNSDFPVLRRLFGSSVVYNTAINDTPEGTYPEYTNNKPASVVVEISESGVSYKVVCNGVYGRTNAESSRSSHNGVTWMDVFEDAEPLAREGAGFEFGTCGLQGGIAVDNLVLTFFGELQDYDDEFGWDYGEDTEKAGYKVNDLGFVWKQILVENASLAVNPKAQFTSGEDSVLKTLNLGELDNGSFSVALNSKKDAVDFEIVTD